MHAGAGQNILSKGRGGMSGAAVVADAVKVVAKVSEICRRLGR